MSENKLAEKLRTTGRITEHSLREATHLSEQEPELEDSSTEAVKAAEETANSVQKKIRHKHKQKKQQTVEKQKELKDSLVSDTKSGGRLKHDADKSRKTPSGVRHQSEHQSERRSSKLKSNRGNVQEATIDVSSPERLRFDKTDEELMRTAKKERKAKQKKQLGRKYGAKLRKEKQLAGATGGPAGKGSVGSRIKGFFKGSLQKKKNGMLSVAALAVTAVATVGSISTVNVMLAGGGEAIFQSSYIASDEDIYAAEAEYCGMENALQRQIDNIEEIFPDYDVYRYQIDPIYHDPYQLASLLTVKHGNYTMNDDEVRDTLERTFRGQYEMTVEPSYEEITETRQVHVGESLGTVVTSGYCNCALCCGQWAGSPTASGAMPTANHTIAVDATNPTVPMGTKVIMNGIEYTVEDTGNFARYGVDFDIYYDNHQTAQAHGHQRWEAYIADDNGSETVEITQTQRARVLNVRVKNRGFYQVCAIQLDEEGMNWFRTLNAAFGNRPYLWEHDLMSEIDGMSYTIPPEALSDEKFRNMITEAEKYLGMDYEWGGSNPEEGFDCSGFVSWVINHCGNGWSVGRGTCNDLKRECVYVSPEEARPGDLIFFQGTYDTTGASHVGIYVGDGMMIHCGDVRPEGRK